MSAARTAVQQSGVAPTTYIDIEQLKSHLSFLEIAREYGIEFRKSGSDEYVALCPFHREKTPSFCLNEAKGVAHCYGCDWSGDQISFVMELENRPFRETVTLLADSRGLNGIVQQTPLRLVRRFSRAQIAEALLFSAGFARALEEHLANLKELCWLSGDWDLPEGQQVLGVTKLLNSLGELTPQEAAEFYYSYRKKARRFAETCVDDANEVNESLARFLVSLARKGLRLV